MGRKGATLGRLCSVLAVLLIMVMAFPRAQAEERDARYAALFIYSVLATGMATLMACQDADAINREIYGAAIGRHVADNFGLYAEINELLVTEATRHGYAAAYYTNLLPEAMNKAKAWARDTQQSDSAGFLETCRAFPKAQRRHVGYFKPLREQYPNEMRLIDEWR